jgi:hypothetical protein
MDKFKSNLGIKAIAQKLENQWGVPRGDNQAGRVGFGFGLDVSGQFDLLEEIESD